MSNPATPRTIHRVLLTMDSPLALTHFAAAAELAASMHAELHGLFVEDANLLRLSELPFAQEICSSSAVARPLTLELVERRLRVLAEQLRVSLAKTAQRAHVAWSFEIARGAINMVSLESARGADLLRIGHRLQPRPTTRSVGFSPRARSSGTGAPTPSESSRLPIAVVYDSSPAARRALTIACQTATWRRAPVEVILPPSEIAAESFRADAAHELQVQGAAGRIGPETVNTFGELRRTLESRKCGLVLLPAESSLLDEVSLT